MAGEKVGASTNGAGVGTSVSAAAAGKKPQQNQQNIARSGANGDVDDATKARTA